MNIEFENTNEEINFAEELDQIVEADEVIEASEFVDFKAPIGHVKVDRLYVRELPKRESRHLAILAKDTQVYSPTNDEKRGEWSKISLADGTVGWVMSEFVNWV